MILLLFFVVTKALGKESESESRRRFTIATTSGLGLVRSLKSGPWILGSSSFVIWLASIALVCLLRPFMTFRTLTFRSLRLFRSRLGI